MNIWEILIKGSKCPRIPPRGTFADNFGKGASWRNREHLLPFIRICDQKTRQEETTKGAQQRHEDNNQKKSCLMLS
jgi:hypothetical protein